MTDTYNENEYDGVEKSFAYNPFFVFWDGDLVLVNELVLNLGKDERCVCVCVHCVDTRVHGDT